MCDYVFLEHDPAWNDRVPHVRRTKVKLLDCTHYVVYYNYFYGKNFDSLIYMFIFAIAFRFEFFEWVFNVTHVFVIYRT